MMARTAAVCLLLLGACHSTEQAARHREEAPFNVLFIVLDDMNDWIQLLDDRAPIQTPHLRRLAEQGVLFTRAYAPSSACNPSRVAVLTGLMPSTSGVYGNATDWRGALPDAVTIPQHFMAHGYRTDGAGKIFHHALNGAFHDTASFHEFQQMPWPPDAPMPSEKLNGLDWYGTRNTDWGMWPDEAGVHVDVRTADYVISRLQDEDDQPFFLAAGIFRPHMPFFAPSEYFERYPHDEVEMPAVREDDLDDVPSGAQTLLEEKRWFFQEMMKAEGEKPGTWREAVRAYQASATFADAQVGRILDALEESRYRNNTVIVLWSDHGYHLGEKQHWEKFALWEKTTRVPFIVVAPGIVPPGSRCAQPVSLVDIYPTLVELCALEPKPELDGRSLLPLLKEPGARWDRPVVTTYGRGNHAVRSDRWRYIRYADGTDELYDEENDPQEWRNVANDPANAETIRELKKSLPHREAPQYPDVTGNSQ